MNKTSAYLLFLTLGAWLTVAALLSSPSDPANAVLFGYSLELILLSGLTFLLGAAPLYLTWKLRRQPEQSQRLWHSVFQQERTRDILLGFTAFVFLSLWIILFFPLYRTESFGPYILRLRPILIWLALVSGTTTFIFLYERRRNSLLSVLAANRTAIQIGLIVLTIAVLFVAFIAATGVGIRYHEDFWFGAGVPLLVLQIIFAILLGGFTAWLEFGRWVNFTPRHDALIVLGIFLLTAFLWAREPLRPNFFLPDTMKNPIYPYSDSATFDAGSQYALIGQGLFNGQYFDRALYSAFLTYVHILAGQDVAKVLTVQAVFFSIFPAVIFLIGKELHSRALGVSAGVLMTLRGVNSIVAMLWIDLAGPKMMMTDFPTAIGIALFLLFALKWIKKPVRLDLAIWCGGMLGLTLMLRTHVLLLMLALIAYILIFGMRIRWNYRLIGSLALIVGMLTATTPWDLRNHATGTPLFYMYYSRIWLVIRYRYGIQGNISPAPSAAMTSLTYAPRAPLRGLSAQPMTNKLNDPVCHSFACKLLNHIVHNLITSFVFLPSSLRLDDLWNVIKVTTPFWQGNWTGGGIPFSGYILFFADLVLLSLGIGLAWQKHKWMGILPLGIFFVYLLTNTFGLTSGGRYVAPVDWVIILYFLLGILQILLWVMRWAGVVLEEQVQVEEEADISVLKVNRFVKLIPSLVLLFGIGALIPLSEHLFTPRYQVQSVEQTLTELEQKGLLEKAGFTREEMAQFMRNPDARMIIGRAVYPRFYRAGGGEPDRSTYYVPLEYPRLVFTVLGPYMVEPQGVVIPGEKPNFQIHETDVIVFGCWNTTYYVPFLDAAVVFVTSDPGYVYNRGPSSPLQCPLQTP